jgi:hypothetical protein
MTCRVCCCSGGWGGEVNSLKMQTLDLRDPSRAVEFGTHSMSDHGLSGDHETKTPLLLFSQKSHFSSHCYMWRICQEKGFKSLGT